MYPLIKLIQEAQTETLAGLHAKALVAIFGTRASHDGYLSFNDEVDLWSLLSGFVAVTEISSCYERFAEDDAVNLRRRGNGHKYPFFDESRLVDRAKSVLKILKIDTRQFDILGARPPFG
jgi:hypothetical protein